MCTPVLPRRVVGDLLFCSKDGSLLTTPFARVGFLACWYQNGQERREDADPQTTVHSLHSRQSRFHLVCEGKTSNLKSH